MVINTEIHNSELQPVGIFNMHHILIPHLNKFMSKLNISTYELKT